MLNATKMLDDRQKIVDKFPRFFKTDPEFSCGPGWYPIVEELLEKVLKDLPEGMDPPEIAQIKEKFGALRIYFVYYYDMMFALVQEAECKSAQICELCGKEGLFFVHNGWWMTRCDECRPTKQQT